MEVAVWIFWFSVW